jgi:hypothetical protein
MLGVHSDAVQKILLWVVEKRNEKEKKNEKKQKIIIEHLEKHNLHPN